MVRLGQAIHLHIRMVSDRPRYKEIADYRFYRICRKKRIVKKAGAKESFIAFILNSCALPNTSLPIKYYRRHASYTPHTPYTKYHLKCSRLIPMVDPLIEVAFVEHATALLFKAQNVGRKSRISPSENVIRLFPLYDLEDLCFLGWADNKGIIQLGEPKIVQEKAKMTAGKEAF
jgi:hypothetical protein